MKINKEKLKILHASGLKPKEIATALDVNPGSVYTALARLKLRQNRTFWKEIAEYSFKTSPREASIKYGKNVGVIYIYRSRYRKLSLDDK